MQTTRTSLVRPWSTPSLLTHRQSTLDRRGGSTVADGSGSTLTKKHHNAGAAAAAAAAPPPPDDRTLILRVLLSTWYVRILWTNLLLYAVFVLVQLSLVDPVAMEQHTALWIVDLVYTSIFTATTLLRMAVLSNTHGRDWRLIADVCWSIFTVVLTAVVDTVDAPPLLGVFQVHSVIRCLWLVIPFERAVIHARIMEPIAKQLEHSQNSQFVTPLEQCIGDLQMLQLQPKLEPATRQGIQHVIETLRNGDLFKPIHDGARGEGLDQQTAAWLEETTVAEFQPRAPPRFTMRNSVDYDEDVFQVVPRSHNSSAHSAVSGMIGSADEADVLHKIHAAKSMRINRRQAENKYNNQLQMLDFLDGTRPLVESVAPERKRRRSSGAREALAMIWSLMLRTVKLRKRLARVNSWCFDMFTLVDISHGHPLFVISNHLLDVHDVCSTLQLNEATLHRLLLRIESGYNINPYHNSLHAADVVQSTHYFLIQPLLLPFMSPMHILTAILAAAAHDYAHPGVNNAFEVATRSALALMYNDMAVLENMHASSLFLLLSEHDLNLLAPFSTEDAKKFRQLAIALILGTDMARHFEDFTKFKARIAQVESVAGLAAAAQLIVNPADAQFMMQMAVHTSDVSNPAKPLTFYCKWVTRVMDEFYAQGDREKSLGLPVSTFFDREHPNVPKFQLGFIDFIVGPLFNEWAKIVTDVASTIIPLLNVNRSYWEHQAFIVPIHSIVISIPNNGIGAPAPAAGMRKAVSPAAATLPGRTPSVSNVSADNIGRSTGSGSGSHNVK